MIDPTILEYVITHQQTLLQTDFAKELWMIPDRMTGEYVSESGKDIFFSIETFSPLYEGKLFVYDKMFYGIVSFERVDDRSKDIKTFRVIANRTGIKYNAKENQPLCTPQDVMVLKPDVIENYKGKESVETTLGIFVANWLFLVYPFGDKIPYLNEEFTASKLEKRIAPLLLEGQITAHDVKSKYVNTLSLFGGSNEIFCPGISEKTITIPKAIHDLRDRLVKENKDALEAGDASVMSDIEKQLITAYKEHLKGDSSLHFLLKKKYFDVTLKKLFLTQGMTEIFGSPGKFTFIENPMGNGWKQKDLPVIFNEVRSGSYSRAIETADGGVIAKLILRVLQDTRIVKDDCETTRGEHIFASKDILTDFLWNYVVNSDGSTTVITQESIPSLVNKELVVRTPGYCQAELGFCAKCFGHTFEVLGQKAFAPVANGFSQTITSAALKKMHGSAHQSYQLESLNKYVI